MQASVAKQITVTTFLNGQAVESAGFGEGTELDLLGLSILGDQRREIVGFVASSPFNGVELTVSSNPRPRVGTPRRGTGSAHGVRSPARVAAVRSPDAVMAAPRMRSGITVTCASRSPGR